jgi:hypothetical protein
MNGTKRVVVITERDRTLLEKLLVFRVVNREQASQIASYSSIGRANKILLRLVRAGMLNRFWMATEVGGVGALYALSRKAIQLIGAQVRPIKRKADALLATDFFVVHQLAINSVLLNAIGKKPNITASRLLTFRSVLSKNIPLLPDAYFELGHEAVIHPMFLEVDLGNESLKVLEKKALLYLSFAASGEFQLQFKQLRFRVLIVCSSDRRLENIRRAISKHTNKLFRLSTLNAINSDGLFAPVWLRPEGVEKQSLL